MIEILVIENTSTGIEYVTLLKEYRQSDWNVKWVYGIAEAIEYAKNNKLHVLVFDQRLNNNELGTTAFKEIIKINPLVQGIMLSGMATADELSEAERFAGGSCFYLNKKNVLELPYKVEEAIIKFYLSPRNRVLDNKEIKIKNHLFPLLHKVKLKLLYHYLIDDFYTLDNAWKVEERGRAGIKLSRIEEKKLTNKVIVSLKNRVNYDFKTGVNIKAIENSITSFYENEVLKTEETIEEYSKKIETEIILPQIPNDIKKDFLAELRYEKTLVYKYYRAHFSLECTLCGNGSFFDFDVFIPTNEIAYRQVSIYSNKDRNIVML